jgi:UDP-N-acetylmuramate dehydrogenase
MSNLICLSKFTTLGIGGKARVEIARSVDDLIKNSTSLVLGNGSNVLASDKNLAQKVVINRANEYALYGETLYAESGCLISALAVFCAQASLTGLEWAYMLPASIGGAIVMNAGAFGKQISDVVERVGVLRNGKVIELTVSECGFSYRSSAFYKDDIVLYAFFRLKRSKREDCECNLSRTKALRTLQPKGKSAGCVYKSEDKSAGWYIEQAGLKNKSVGDIYVSPVHAGFFINGGKGTAKDMLALMDYVEKTVEDRFNKKLTREIKLIGEF